MQEGDFPYYFTNHIRVHLLNYCFECVNNGPMVEVDVFDYTAPDEATGYTYTSEINIEKGWNLISSNLDHIAWEYSTCDKENFEAVYAFDNEEKKYVSGSDPESLKFSKDYLRESAVWVYSNKKCKTVFFDLDTKDVINLKAGWNFLSLTNGLKNKF